MDERVIRFRVGILVLASALICVILIFVFGEMPSVLRGYYTVYIHFPTAPGVTVDTPVRKNGILIGRVRDVKLLDDGVQITTRIDANRRIGRNEVARIASQSLLGDAVIEFVPSGDPSPPDDYITDGEFIADGVVAGNPLEAFDVLINLEAGMADAMNSIRVAGDDVSYLAQSLNAVVENNQAQFTRILQKSETTLESVSLAMNSVNRIVGDDELQDRLRTALDEIPQLMADARETLAALQRMSARAETNLANLEGLTEPLGERGDAIVANIDSSVGQLNEMLQQLATFSATLNNGEGTLGQLTRNPELYQRLNRAAENIEEVTDRLRPIIEDVRVATDKIARNPRQLGMQGAIDRQRSGTKYLVPQDEGARRGRFLQEMFDR